MEKPAAAEESQESNVSEALTAAKSRGLSLAPGPESLSTRARFYEAEVGMHARVCACRDRKDMLAC